MKKAGNQDKHVFEGSQHVARKDMCQKAIALSVIGLCAGTAYAEDTRTLAPLEVNGKVSSVTEGSGSYKAEQSVSATGLNLSAKETPQSVTTITRQQLDDKAITTLDQALTSSAGITLTELDVGARTTYRSRGGEISNYRVDGMAYNGTTGFSGLGSAINMDLYDRIDILRGANGLLGGTGDASATIDLARKRPAREFGGQVTLQAGSWDQRRIVGDLNTPSSDGSVRSRLVISSEQADSFRERAGNENYGALANFEMDLGKNTTLGAGIQFEKAHIKGATWGANVPIWFADGTTTRLSRKTNPVADWSYRETEATTVFASLDQKLGRGWKSKLSAARMDGSYTTHLGVAKVNSTTGGYGGYWNQDGTGAILNAYHAEGDNFMKTMDWKLSGPFDLFGRIHELVAGYGGSWSETTAYGLSCSLNGTTLNSNCQSRISASGRISNWQTWDGSFAPLLYSRTGARTITKEHNYGAYLASRFSLTDPLALILGARLSTYTTYVESYSATGATSRGSASGNDNVLTPYLGLTYDINPTYAVYASYTETYKPQAYKDSSGKYLDPITGASYETGLKAAYLDGRLNANLAIFQIEQQNVAEADGANLAPDGTQAYTAKGSGVKTQGYELELAGAIQPGWNAYAAYTYLYVNDPSTSARSDPRHLIRLDTTYRLPGNLHRFTLGGGLTAQGGIPSESTPAGYPTSTSNGVTKSSATQVKLPGYALFSAMLRYQATQTTTLTLNVSNLLDRTYYRRYGFYAGSIYGEPRRITLTMNTRF